MNLKIDDYVNTLLSNEVSVSELDNAKKILSASDELMQILNSPSVSKDEKKKVVDEIFSTSVKSLVLHLSEECRADELGAVIDAYSAALDRKNKVARATLICVTEPDENQLKGIEEFVCKEENAGSAKIEIVKDDSLIGGFIIRIGNKQYDRSLKSKISSIKEKIVNDARRSSSVDTDGIISILRSEIKDFDFETNSEEVGSVIRVGDGIATIHGLDHVMYGEIVVFDCGIKGMVQDIKRSTVGCIVFGNDNEIHEGSKVRRTHKNAGVPVGEAFIGRIVNSLGEAIDGKGDIVSDEFRLIENPAPSIVERKSVSEPLETGILSIDSMFPIGRGQRELIIGDRQTGKTSIAIDTIINQKGKNCICIYNAIGQKASTVAKLVSTLEKNGAMDYTIIVCSTASDSASLQYISPYSATAIAEYFMHKGRDCLIVYDDLSKHAVAYRALSLLLERSPGREAYPGDVFYLHSRLLERAARLSDELGGGSLTALPIIETQAGDVSAYIPTNVISITDGQIYLETEMFNSGFRPAVNAGLSVSRVGGAAQIKAMKKISGPIRIELAQFRELAAFSQFSSDLDPETKAQLAQGERIREILKQDQYNPMPVENEVMIIYAATKKYLIDIEVSDILDFEKGLFEYIDTKYPDVPESIRTVGEILEDTEKKLVKAIEEFKADFTKNR